LPVRGVHQPAAELADIGNQIAVGGDGGFRLARSATAVLEQGQSFGWRQRWDLGWDRTGE